MGGMSAQIPIKGDEEANAKAMAKVKADKLREVTAGHDGTWIAHPLIRKIAMDVFDEHMPGPNQLHVRREEVVVTAADLLNHKIVGGKITDSGVKANVEAALAYCAAWLSGNGCVPINHLMEDAATAEIARMQLWQWVYHGASLDNGKLVTPEYIDSYIKTTAPGLTKTISGVTDHHVEIACNYLSQQIRKDRPSEFLTTDLYGYLDGGSGGLVSRRSML